MPDSHIVSYAERMTVIIFISCVVLVNPAFLNTIFLEEKLVCYGWVHTSKGLEPDMWWLVKGVGLCEKE